MTQITSQLASVVMCEAHDPVLLNGDAQCGAGQVRQGCQEYHSRVAGHLQQGGKGSVESKNELSQPIVVHTTVFSLAAQGTSTMNTKTFENKSFDVGLKHNVTVLILPIFFLPHQRQI